MGTGTSLCRTCTKYLLLGTPDDAVLIDSLPVQLYKTSILFPANGATMLALQFLSWGGFGGNSKDSMR